jgi:hypothetical protein
MFEFGVSSHAKRCGSEFLGRLRTLAQVVVCALALSSLVQVQPGLTQGGGLAAPGDAVVTNFSGVKSAPEPQSGAPALPSIDPQGPSAFLLRLAGAPFVNANTARPQVVSSVQAAQVGQVFAVAISAQEPVAYLGATSKFGLRLIKRDPQTGAPVQITRGEPGAEWMEGQWGAGGGPGSIWRYDLANGTASLFTTLPENGGPSLGGVAADPVTGDVYASSLESGLIYRIGRNGQIAETFDHGTQGRPAANEPPVADTGVRASIADPAFETERPETWGFTAPERQVFGMAVFQGRLYYAVPPNAGVPVPQIWSVSVEGGRFGADVRREIVVQSDFPAAITSLAFDEAGALYAAQRGTLDVPADFSQFAVPRATQTLRFERDPNGVWRETAQSYPVGRAPDFNFTAGGVSLACRGTLNVGNGDPVLLSTHDGILPPQDPNQRHGLQANGISALRPSVVDTSSARFAIFGPDGFEAAGFMGDVKTLPCAPAPQVTQFVEPVPPPIPVCPGPGCLPPPPPPPPPPLCPVDTVLLNDGFCCPVELVQRDGRCLPRRCPPNQVLARGGECCPVDFIRPDGRCEPRRCPPGTVILGNGDCCPANFVQRDGTCRPNQCPPPNVRTRDGVCCPPGSRILQNGRCCPPGAFCAEQCPRPLVGNFPDCRCPNNGVLVDGRCQPPARCRPPLVGTPPNCRCSNPADRLVNGQCVPPPQRVCPPPSIGVFPNCRCPNNGLFVNGQCVPPPQRACPPPSVGVFPNCRCPNNGLFVNGQCVPPPQRVCPPPSVGVFPNCRCPNNGVLVDGRCQPPAQCRPPLVGTPPNCRCPNPADRLVNGQCVPPPQRVCPPPTVGTVPNCRCPNNGVLVDGRCQPPAQCRPPLVGTPPNCRCPNPADRLVNGQCVPPQQRVCPPPTVGTVPNCRCPSGAAPVNGTCPPQTCPPNTMGIYPNCKPIAPKVCPPNTTGQYPNCKPIEVPRCPPNTVGVFPNCQPMVRVCPAGTVGTPPNCQAPKAVTCPPGTVGQPPNCQRVVPQQPPIIR